MTEPQTRETNLIWDDRRSQEVLASLSKMVLQGFRISQVKGQTRPSLWWASVPVARTWPNACKKHFRSSWQRRSRWAF